MLFKIIIDNLVETHYLHYRFSETALAPTVRNIDVYYNKIWEYVVDKYLRRVRRMINSGELPTFAIVASEPSYTPKMQAKIIDAISASNFKLCLITNDYPNQSYGNICIIHYDIEALTNTIQQARMFGPTIIHL